MITINPILQDILSTKRPTNNPDYCLSYTANLLQGLGITYTVDEHKNITVDLGGTTCFTAHTDTVDNKLGKNILHIKDNIVRVKGGGILGADCGSGMYLLIRMIQANTPALYVFFSTEEQGRIGSSRYRMPERITKCVSFDRKGTNNLITHQMGERGCSELFADAFIDNFQLPYFDDPTGSFTDSYSFFDTVPECVNLSVGYYNQHSKDEHQDLNFLEALVDACIAMDWEALPIGRDPDAIKQWFGRNMYQPTDAEELLDFVYDHPHIVADLLDQWGITLRDLEEHKALCEY